MKNKIYIIIIAVSILLSLNFVLKGPNDDQLLSIPNDKMTDWNQADFFQGKKLFKADWVAADPQLKPHFSGLGPNYSQTSCISCHINNGRGAPARNGNLPFTAGIKISQGNNSLTGPSSTREFGTQLNYYNTLGNNIEADVKVFYTDTIFTDHLGNTYELRVPNYDIRKSQKSSDLPSFNYSVRISPQVYGLGIVELIPKSEILSLADPSDNDGNGISGRANSVSNPKNEERTLGRFGWKASISTLEHQVSLALWAEIGITNKHFPKENHIKVLGNKEGGLDSLKSTEISDEQLKKLINYVRWLAVPKNNKESHGEGLFNQIGCASCHKSSYKVDIGGKTELIHPYSDFLLHDMGSGLADGFAEFEASESEWRTPPLWGLGITQKVNDYLFLLHDGRARSFTEAILWHGGEGANSRNKFLLLKESEKEELIKFLKSI